MRHQSRKGVRQMTIRDRIKERLMDLNLSMRKASLDAGLGQTAIRDILKNSDQDPRLGTMVQMSRALRTPLDWLINGDGPKEIDLETVLNQQMESIWPQLSTKNKELSLQILEAFAEFDRHELEKSPQVGAGNLSPDTDWDELTDKEIEWVKGKVDQHQYTNGTIVSGEAWGEG